MNGVGLVVDALARAADTVVAGFATGSAVVFVGSEVDAFAVAVGLLVVANLLALSSYTNCTCAAFFVARATVVGVCLVIDADPAALLGS